MPPRTHKRVFSLVGFDKGTRDTSSVTFESPTKKPRVHALNAPIRPPADPSRAASALFTFTSALHKTLPTAPPRGIRPSAPPELPQSSPEQLDKRDDLPRQSLATNPPARKTKSGKGQNEMLQDWLRDCADIYMNRLLASYDLKTPRLCDECETNEGLYRCDNCLSDTLYCKICLHTQHRFLPCHRWRKWNGQFFQPVTSRETGFVLHLGHHGQVCSMGTERQLTLLDLNGHHDITCRFCEHPGHPDQAGQLLAARIYPATDKRPSSGFTFGLLKYAYLAEVEGKLSMQRFYDMLVQQTNSVFPHLVPNRYRELMRVAREWNILTFLRRSGVWTTKTARREPFDLALRCPSCPRMNINVCLDDITESNAHLFVLHLNYDGSFQLYRKDKPSDRWDIALTDHQLYFVRDKDLQSHIEAVDITSRQQTTKQAECNNHRAAESQWVKFTGLAETGVGAVTCARHSFFMPGGSTNYTTGERYIYADYVLGSVLGTELKTGLTRFGVHYDVMCHYLVHMWDRWAALGSPLRPLSRENFEIFLAAIGKFHLAAHQETCYVRYSLNNITGVGRLDGEGAERCWADLNLASHTTSERGPGARLDTLNATMHYWNWCKCTGQLSSLVARARDAKLTTAQHKESWEDFNSSIDETLTSRWKLLSTEPYIENGRWTSVFSLSQRNATSVGTVMDSLKSDELAKALLGLANAPVPGCADWILSGIRLESTQMTLQRDVKLFGGRPSPGQSLNLTSRRKALSTALLKHRELAPQFCNPPPGLAASTAEVSEHGEPETLSTMLPSSYPSRSLRHDSYKSVVEMERALRRSLCQITLKEFRACAANKAHLTKTKTSRHRSTQVKLRAQSSLDAATTELNWVRTRYNEHRDRLMQLGGSAEDRSIYQCLRERDAQEIHDMFLNDRRLGEGTRSIPWYWRVSLADREGSSGMRDRVSHLATEDYEDGLRLQWFTARERFKRWEEERHWIQRETASLVLSFNHQATAWERRCQAHPEVAQAYCRRQATVWKQLTHDAAQRALPVLEDKSVPTQPLVDRVLMMISNILPAP